MVALVSPGEGVTREDVLVCYEVILGRQPESEDAITFHLQFPDRKALAMHMLTSAEFGLRGLARETVHNDQLYKGYEARDLAVFERFRPYQGPGTAGFVTNFLGVRVRTSFSTPLKSFDGYVEGYPMPVAGVQGETAEFIGTLRSVLDAQDGYTLLECGAGYGPWMAITAAAARQRGLDRVRLYGIEGDPGHFSFMSEHLRDNGIDPNTCTLILGALGAESGIARWEIAHNPADVYGGRPIDDNVVTNYWSACESQSIEIEVHSINDLLKREQKWDLVHMDIQGGEGNVCRGGILTMNQRVCRMVIGTHSRALDGELMRTFHAAGWILENEKPTIMKWRDGERILESMTTCDGIQVWRNPRLAGSPSV